jgi:HD superfamily phosphohydrolase YqeK
VSAVRAAACRLANLHKKDPRDPAAITTARHDLVEARLERAILQGLNATPLLPAVRRLRLAQILMDGGIR